VRRTIRIDRETLEDALAAAGVDDPADYQWEAVTVLWDELEQTAKSPADRVVGGARRLVRSVGPLVSALAEVVGAGANLGRHAVLARREEGVEGAGEVLVDRVSLDGLVVQDGEGAERGLPGDEVSGGVVVGEGRFVGPTVSADVNVESEEDGAGGCGGGHVENRTPVVTPVKPEEPK
jgi:hypothetical protein